jgi:hypothetical protein
MAHEGSSPCSQEPSTGPYPEPDQSSPYHPILPLQDLSKYYPPTYIFVFLVVSFILPFSPIIYVCSSSPFMLHDLLILLDLTILIKLGHEYKLRSAWLCSFLHPPVTWSLFSPNIPLSTLFSITFSLCSSLNVRDQDSHSYRTIGKSIVLYFNFYYSWQKVRI